MSPPAVGKHSYEPISQLGEGPTCDTSNDHVQKQEKQPAEYTSAVSCHFHTEPVDDDLPVQDMLSDSKQDRNLVRRGLITLSILTNGFLIALLAGILITRQSTSHVTQSIINHPPLPSGISLAAGQFAWHRANHSISIVPTDRERLFAPPSPAVDAAWEEIMKFEFFPLQPSEGQQVEEQVLRQSASPLSAEVGQPAELYKKHDGQMWTEVAVYHSIHCLNMIRKAFYNDYAPYVEEMEKEMIIAPNGWKDVHLEHCFENIFHAITCEPDFTPVPLYKYPGLALLLGVTTEKKCADFQAVKEWVKERATAEHGHGAITGV